MASKALSLEVCQPVAAVVNRWHSLPRVKERQRVCQHLAAFTACWRSPPARLKSQEGEKTSVKLRITCSRMFEVEPRGDSGNTSGRLCFCLPNSLITFFHHDFLFYLCLYDKSFSKKCVHARVFGLLCKTAFHIMSKLTWKRFISSPINLQRNANIISAAHILFSFLPSVAAGLSFIRRLAVVIV